MSLRHKRLKRSAIKEAFDNLPCGICFFSENGLVTLCNRTMHRLVFALTGRDLQLLSELRIAVSPSPDNGSAGDDGGAVLLPDGGAWLFAEHYVVGGDGRVYIQFTASEVTELHRAAQELAAKNCELAEMAENMERISRNVVAIAREEEILSMKMRIHNELGSDTLKTRQYILSGCPAQRKTELLSCWRRTLSQLSGGIEQECDSDLYSELQETASAIGAEIELEGELPPEHGAAGLIVAAVRECLTNMIRHAGGTVLHVKAAFDDSAAAAVITNNGSVPSAPITEGGGLGALRVIIEKAGGAMTVLSEPYFSLTVRIPLKGDDLL